MSALLPSLGGEPGLAPAVQDPDSVYSRSVRKWHTGNEKAVVFLKDEATKPAMAVAGHTGFKVRLILVVFSHPAGGIAAPRKVTYNPKRMPFLLLALDVRGCSRKTFCKKKRNPPSWTWGEDR